MRIHHVQVMIPRGRERDAERFYGELLGLERIARPGGMPNPDGLWFRCGEHEVHLGVQDHAPDPTSRAHVAIQVDDFDALMKRLAAAGCTLVPARELGGLRRCHVRDPFENRIEIMG